jgi:AAA15 family ATPase/GTPase
MMLESLYIKNFRLFKELKIERLGRVNLFVGKNNSGKTCLLEALWIYVSEAEPSVLYKIISEREEYWELWKIWKTEKLFDEQLVKSIPPSKHPLRFLFHGYQLTETGIEIGTLESNQKPVNILPSNPFYGFFPPENSQFVSTRPLDNDTILNLWDEIVLTSEEAFIIQCLQLVDPKIQKLSVARGSRVPIVVYDGERVPLKNLGEGMSRVFYMILSLINVSNGFLLVDEFENGIYWQTQQKLWQMFFKLAEELNVQIFVTTHNQDCVQGFHEIWKTQEDKGTFYRLHNRHGKGTSITPYRCETLANALEMDVDIR